MAGLLEPLFRGPRPLSATLAELLNAREDRKEREADRADREQLRAIQRQQMDLQTRRLTREDEAATAAAAKNEAIRGAFMRRSASGKLDEEGVLQDLLQIDPEMAMEFEKQLDERASRTVKSRLDRLNLEKSILEADNDKATKVIELLAASTNDAQWDEGQALADLWRVKGDLRSRGLAGPFSPEAAKHAAGLILGVKGRADQAAKAADDARLAASAAATQADRDADNKRQDASAARQEAIQREQLAISRGNLDVARGNLAARQAEVNTSTTDGGAKLSATAIEKVAGVDQAVGMLDDIERLLPKMRGNIGLVSGRVAGARLATGAALSEDLATFDAQITGLKNAVIKATTGAAMSEPEAKRIMGQLPDMTQPEQVFKARLATTRRNLELLKKRTIELSGGTVDGPNKDADPLGIR